MDKQEVLKNTGYTDVISLNDYLDEIGETGVEWFESFEPEPYFSYDDDKYSDIDTVIRDEFKEKTEHINSMVMERFEVQAGIDENGKAEPIPIVYDSDDNTYLSLSEMAEIIEDELPQEIEVTVSTNRSFSWESGWDYDETELAIKMSYDVSDTLSDIFEEIKKETAPLLDKLSADKEVKAKSSKSKQEVER